MCAPYVLYTTYYRLYDNHNPSHCLQLKYFRVARFRRTEGQNLKHAHLEGKFNRTHRGTHFQEKQSHESKCQSDILLPARQVSAMDTHSEYSPNYVGLAVSKHLIANCQEKSPPSNQWGTSCIDCYTFVYSVFCLSSHRELKMVYKNKKNQAKLKTQQKSNKQDSQQIKVSNS